MPRNISSTDMPIHTPASPIVFERMDASVILTPHILKKFITPGIRVSPAPRRAPVATIEAAEKKDAKLELERALKRLPERERMLLVFYYHENMTLKEIGEAINVSESRVCQLHAQAIMKLRNILSASRQDRMTKSIVKTSKH